MAERLPTDCLIGLARNHLVAVDGLHALVPSAVPAFARLRERAAAAGFDLAIASSWRGYERQLAIFNGKARGERPVHDDHGRVLQRANQSNDRWLEYILRFSALPGTSRHHWGTDLDVYDRAALPPDYALALSPAEYAEGGVQGAFAGWLSERVAADDAEGFYLPYGVDRGGVAPEPWHLSYRPVAASCADGVSADTLLSRWRGDGVPEPLEMLGEVEARRDEIWARFVVMD